MKNSKKLSAIAVICLAMIAASVLAAAQPSTPFLIFGEVSYCSGDPVNNPNITITNLNTSAVFTAETTATSNYYQVLNFSGNASAGNVLNFNASDACNVTEFNHTVTQAEMNSGGFVQNITITLPPMSDLLVTAINAYHNNTGMSPWFNLSNEVDVTVKNNGTAPAGTFNVSLYANDTLIGKQNVSGLDAGNSTTVQFMWMPTGEDCLQPVCEFNWPNYKDYNITAVADCDSDVAESNETNNATTVVERACYNGYMADEPLEHVAHGKLRGHLLFSTGDGKYKGLYSVGDTQTTHYNIVLPEGATVKLAHLNVYYTWCKPEGTCPEMEVNVTTPGGTTYTLPLMKAYNDIKCMCPGASWVLTFGNYVYNVTDYITGNGTYTVTVKNVCTQCNYFCPAAPGLMVLNEDDNAPMIEYWLNEGADVLIGGRRADGGYLAWWECITNATFPASTETSDLENATLGVVSPWAGSAWQPGSTNYLFFNDVKLGSGVYHGYSEMYDETIDSISMHIGSTIAQVGVNVTSVTDYYLKGSDNVVGQADDGDNMMPANAFLVVEYKEPLEVNKTIWNGTAWVKETEAKLNDILRFRCEIHNNGGSSLTNITVVDSLSDSLEYADNATPREPDWTSGNEFGWNFSSLEPCQTITIEFNATAIDYGEDINIQSATAWCEETGEWLSAEDHVSITVSRPGVCGDVDGLPGVTTNDGRQIFMYLLYGPGQYPLADLWAADCDGLCDGITTNDGRQIFMNLLYGSERFPLQCCA